ncbi:Cof-type HAD-IIB family hydrolase [Deinococcus yavapaiensis]|uniref:Cof subfamily protein (Haloacid dehalogenase superfamily)/HAD superfamily hydrolase (TIGR01484 family) n=1 Tax=Deinococcus yavapaiensis KR-236 TaxID=694435 RepID=A0A318S5T3_9DEIO|nr:Cof-type HAD-IIB family hydrolase [Deinococcus yavapaiensis]PYE53070.1 hypothetical protein DES52_11053 [Deinococcus yavapaiensis KR-236]
MTLGLVCIDVDGTLVGTGGVIPEVVWDAVSEARAAGIHLCLTTGRPAFGVAREYARRLDDSAWHIFQNGASIVNVSSLASRSEGLPSVALANLVNLARRTNRILEVYTDDAYAVERTDRAAVEHAALLGVPFVPRDLLSLDGKVVRAQWVVPLAMKDELLSEANEDLTVSPATSPVMPDALFVSLTKPGVSKASAVTAVAASYGVPLERVMMVGDAHNDVGAMGVVGHAVAMGNADADAREAARYHVGHVDAGGLAQALRLALTL